MHASSVLSAVLGAVSKEAGTLISEEVKLLWGAKENLEKMQTTLSLIQAFLDDAEKKHYDQSSVKLWLYSLKDVAYAAQDVIDEVATYDLRRRVEANRINWVSSFFLSCSSCSAPIPVWFHYQIARKLRSTRDRLDWILKEGNALGLQQSLSLPSHLLEPPAERPPRETSSAVTEPRVVGREAEIENLVGMLLSSPDNSNVSSSDSALSFSVISIIGMGGLGKTTLTQLVYNDERVQAHFPTKVWIYVSAKFDTLRLMKEIIERITITKEERSELTSLDGIQSLLGMKLSEKRFLLVLDDVWNEDPQKWKELCVPLCHGSIGSKVLITTRNRSAADTAAPMTPINLGILSDDECWSILQNHAFDDQRTADNHPRLQVMGREIAVKAKGVPLAAKVLGGILKSVGLDENRWRGILEADLSQVPEGESAIMPVLRLSYQHLPSNLKQCFAYSVVFPKGFSLNKDRLVGMWMALGFIQTRGSERIEDVGVDYFNALLGRSFFQFSEGRYNMHDLMHDLAQSVSDDEYFIIEDPDLSKVPKKVRYLTLRTITIEMLEKLHKFQKLRSLLFFCKYERNFTPVLEKLFKQLKKLRILDLDCHEISQEWDCGFCCCLGLCGAVCCKCEHPPCMPNEEEELPSSIGSLKHLRYLHLNFRDLKQLPESLGTLYNLQTLIASECTSLNRLPNGMSNLVSLRQLNANDDIVCSISYIGKLTSLQGLQKFCVGRENGRKIGELSNLNQIRGRLSISKLDNSISREESMEAKLDDKHYINELVLEWSDDRDAGSINSRIDEGVLAGLKPHANLKELVMKNYGGMRCTGWMQNQLPSFLETVRLFSCTKMEDLPPLGHLQFLKVLEVKGMVGISQLNSFKGYPSLEDLVFKDMPRWDEWSGEGEGQLFPCLRRFGIYNCPQLRGLPPLPPSLEVMSLVGVGLHVLPEISGCPLKTELSSNSSLPLPLPLSANADATEAPSPPPPTERTTLQSFSSSHAMPDLSESPSSGSLEEIILQNLGEFNTFYRLLGLPEKDMPSLSPSPSLLSSSFSSLSKLEISKCPNLASLSEGLLQQDLGALCSLRISDCERLVNLPEHGLPSSIQLLTIKRCPLLKDRCLYNGGPDWPKISHIPCIQIDGQWVRGAQVGEAINEAHEKLNKVAKEIAEFISSLFSDSEGQPPESSSSTAKGNDLA